MAQKISAFQMILGSLLIQSSSIKRDKLKEMGIVIEDKEDGPRWKKV